MPGKGIFCLLKGHQGPVTGLSWSPHEAALLLSTSHDCSAQIWDVVLARGLVNLRGHDGRVLCGVWSRIRPNLVYTGSDDQSFRQWDISSQPTFTQPPSVQEVKKKKLPPRAKPEPQAKIEPAEASASRRPSHTGSVSVQPKPVSGPRAPSIFQLDPSMLSSVEMAKGDSKSSSLVDACLFGSTDISELLDSDSSPLKVNLDIWQGRLPQVCHERAGNLNPHLVAMSAAAGRDVWVSMCGQFAQQLADSGDTHTAALYYLVSGAVRPAVELYLKANLFPEALALAKARLLPEDQLVSRCYLLWGQHAESQGQSDLAAKCFLGAGQGSRAILTLFRSGGAAQELASTINDPSALGLARQKGEQHQVSEEWSQAQELYGQFQELRPMLLFCHAEETVAKYLHMGQVREEKSSIPLVNLVLQSWMLAGCLPTNDEAKTMCDALAGIDQRYLSGEKQIPRVRALVAIRVSQFCLLGLCKDPSSSTQLLAESADLLYQNQLYTALERFGILVSFPRLPDLLTQGHLPLYFFGIWTVLLLQWAGRECSVTVEPEQMMKLLSPVQARLSVCLFQARLLEEEQKSIHQQLQGLHLSLKDQLRVNKAIKTKTPTNEESQTGSEETKNAEIRQTTKRQAKLLESRLETAKGELAALVQEMRVTQSSQELVRPFPCPFLSAALLLSTPNLQSNFIDSVWGWGEANACTPMREHFEKRDLEGVTAQVITQTGFSFQRLQTFKEGAAEK